MSQEYKYCMNCGEKLPADAKFCKCCGRTAEDPTVERPPEKSNEKPNEASNKKASDNKPLTKSTIAVVLILTAVVAVGAAVLTVAGIKAAYGI